MMLNMNILEIMSAREAFSINLCSFVSQLCASLFPENNIVYVLHRVLQMDWISIYNKYLIIGFVRHHLFCNIVISVTHI